MRGIQILRWGIKFSLKLVSHFESKFTPFWGLGEGVPHSAPRRRLSMWSFIAKLCAM